MSLVLVACADDPPPPPPPPPPPIAPGPALTATPGLVQEEPPPPPSNPLEFVPIELGFELTGPSGFRFVPGRELELLVTEHGGIVRHVRIDGDTAIELGSFEVPEVLVETDCGLLAIELDPEWETNHLVYFGHCTTGYITRITRITFDGTNYAEAAGTASIVLDVPMPMGTRPSLNHNIGTIGFEPDGTLWALIGDKGTEEGQNPNRFMASLIRIVPDRTETGSGYVPAEGNAFAEGEGLPEIYAKGLRYGWRATRDARGRFFVGDVGGSTHEEVNLVTEPGQFFGWRLCEGPCAEPMPEQTDPLIAWPHVEDEHPYIDDDPEALPTTRHVGWVGLQYTSGTDRYAGMLTDRIVFGDMCLGWVRALQVDAAGEVVEDAPIAHLAHVTDWVPGPDGYVYTTTFGSCNSLSVFEPAALYRVVPSESAMR